MNTHLRLGSAAGPLGLRRQDLFAFCMWVAILVASVCDARPQDAPTDTTFNSASFDSFLAGGAPPPAPVIRVDPAPAPRETVATSIPIPVVDSIATDSAAAASKIEPPISADFARHLVAYQEDHFDNGAVTLLVAAHVEYRHALAQIAHGEHKAAEKTLRKALSLAPRFSDAYFTLAKLHARRFHPDTVYYFVEGMKAQLQSFDGQRALLMNAIIGTMLVLLIASAIVWIALAVRYFPFIVHRIAESARNKFSASGGRVAATLLLLAPFALLPGYTTAAALILVLTWPFMHRRERVLSFVMAGTFAVFAGFAPALDRYSVVADPASLTSLIARASESSADQALARAISQVPVTDTELEDDRYTALGMLAMRGHDSEGATANFLRAISINKESAIAYVNLGNVYYLNGQFTRALEGYRKAEEVDSSDAIGQYNLAQAYIKTLLMGESSRALSRASKLGLEDDRMAIADPARSRMTVHQKTYSSAQLWEIAFLEGAHHNPGVISGVLRTATGNAPRTSTLIIAIAMALAIAAGHGLNSRKLAFQCANCGELTCDGCCNDELGSVICRSCGEAVEGVSSDRVLEALLRQRRQAVIVRRRKSIRWATVWFPGMRHVFYGRFVSGFAVAAFFAASLLAMCTHGFVFPFWESVEFRTPLWKWVVPFLGIGLAYLIALMSRQLFEARNTRTVTVRGTTKDENADTASQSA